MEGHEGQKGQEGHEGQKGQEGQEGQEGHVHKLEFLPTFISLGYFWEIFLDK